MSDTDDDLTFMLGQALRDVGKPILRQLATEHAPDVPRQIAAARMLAHIRRAGYDIGRTRPPAKAHSTSLGGKRK